MDIAFLLQISSYLEMPTVCISRNGVTLGLTCTLRRAPCLTLPFLQLLFALVRRETGSDSVVMGD